MIQRNTDSNGSTEHRPLVLHVRTVNGFGGGPEKTILNSPRFLRTLGYESECLYLHPPRDAGVERLVQRAQESEAPLVLFEDRGQFDVSLIGKLTAYCREHNVQIWHAHDDKTNALGLAVRRRWKMKLVTTCHGWVAKPTVKNRIHGMVSKTCLPLYDFVIAVSPDLEAVVARWFVRKCRRALIFNAIDTGQYKRSLTIQAAREKLTTLPNAQILLVGLGRLALEKGFGRLIDSVGQLRASGLDIGLAIGGEGELREQLQGQISKLGLENHVHLLGHVSDPRTLIQAADVFVLSSLREGLPNVVLEAMALETPVVATRVAGVPRLITDNVHGLLVDIYSAAQLQNAIKRMACDESLRKTLAANARLRIENDFDFAKRMSRIADIYNGLLDGQKTKDKSHGTFA